MDINIFCAHQLNDSEAVARIRRLIAEKTAKHKNELKSFEEAWQADGSCVLKGKVMGFSLSGKIEFLSGRVKVIVSVPMLLGMFRGKIVSEIRKELIAALKN
ncbi:MAG: polyhydroxyalkanoic acid system family protein [bacterium]|nr:polyhydroxyalkanoic acid system family protein [bacterium]